VEQQKTFVATTSIPSLAVYLDYLPPTYLDTCKNKWQFNGAVKGKMFSMSQSFIFIFFTSIETSLDKLFKKFPAIYGTRSFMTM